MNESTSSEGMNKSVAITTKELEELKDSRIPENTKRKNKWIMKMFLKWLSDWRTRLDGELKILKDLNEMTLKELDLCIQFFISEIRKVDGELYPPQTYREIVAGIQHHLNNVLGKKCSVFRDKEFYESRKVLDAVMKKAAAAGKKISPKRSHSISFTDEEKLWEVGTFGTSNPKQLLHTLIYHLGLHLSLRAGQEHRDLTFGENSQLKLKISEDGLDFIEYTERFSKNKRFGINDCRRDPKVTCIYPNKENPNRCVVALYKKYLSHRPQVSTTDAFYLSPKTSITNNIWYKNQPYGIHSIEKVTRQIMSTIKENVQSFTNTSLRRTAQMRLLQSNIPVEITRKKTGRVSEKATSSYIESENFERKMSTSLYSEERYTETIQTKRECLKDIFSGENHFSNCTFNFNF